MSVRAAGPAPTGAHLRLALGRADLDGEWMDRYRLLHAVTPTPSAAVSRDRVNPKPITPVTPAERDILLLQRTAGNSAVVQRASGRWQDLLDEDHDEGPRNQRMSDGNKMELEDSGWLKARLPDPDRRREFMKWLEQNHRQGEEHVHLRPGSREAQAMLDRFLQENP